MSEREYEALLALLRARTSSIAYWQARRSDRRGVGLGLSIASGIIDAHGGRIWVDSTVGAGTSFRFTLPRAV